MVMTPSNKNEIMTFWESDATELELPWVVFTKETEPYGSKPVIVCELEELEIIKSNDDMLDRKAQEYNFDWSNRQDDEGNYYVYFYNPDDAVWFANNDGYEELNYGN